MVRTIHGLCYILGDDNGTTTAGIGTFEDASMGWLDWFLRIRVVWQSWAYEGAFGFVGRLTGWATT